MTILQAESTRVGKRGWQPAEGNRCADRPSKGKQRIGAAASGERSIDVKVALRCQYGFDASDHPVGCFQCLHTAPPACAVRVGLFDRRLSFASPRRVQGPNPSLVHSLFAPSMRFVMQSSVTAEFCYESIESWSPQGREQYRYVFHPYIRIYR